MRSGKRPTPAGSDRAPADESFRAAVIAGLLRPHKELPCKFFYDARGSQLFEQICELEDYYLTRTELAIMHRHAREMAARLGEHCLLIEYGSGSSIKTRLLLNHLREAAAYVPIDISREHLARTARALSRRYPNVDVQPLWTDFTTDFELPPVARPAARRVVYFPGSTIGNFEPDAAVVLLRRIARLCGPGGGLLLGADLKKDAAIIERAYNDRAGVTAAFNINLLVRINRELGADFQSDAFRHQAFYNQEQGRIEMHLVSEGAQVVHIDGREFAFAQGESIRTEYSYKYSLQDVRDLARPAGLEVKKVWTDEERLFSVQYLTVIV
jgi:dimethylhistidine N-methyltransferase